MSEDRGSGEERDVLAYWRAVELFSAQPVPGHDEERVFDLDDGPLPWERGHPLAGEWIRSSNEWQHYVYVGVYSLDEAYDALRRVLSDHSEDDDGDPPYAGESALAAFVVAADGRVILGPQTLSGCAWALSRAFNKGAQARNWLRGFEEASWEFVSGFEDLLGAAEDDEDARDIKEEGHSVGTVVDLDLLDQVRDLIAELLDVERVDGAAVIAKAQTIRVQSRAVGHANRYRTRSRGFLNSFIASDLGTVADALAKGDGGPGLRRYLRGGEKSEGAPRRADLDLRLDWVRLVLAPEFVPLGRWPRAVSETTDMGQQVAINVGFNQAPDWIGRLLSVNGPPGTGKTTMLRDLIAALIVARAERLAKLASPNDAFKASPIKLQIGTRRCSVYQLKDSFTGFELVLACTTNAAAENVSREIPLAQAIAPEWRDRADYFAEIATSMLRGEHAEDGGDGGEKLARAWGLLAAPLGSVARCQAFATAFWFGRPAPSTEEIQRNGKGPDASDSGAGLLEILRAHKATPAAWKQAVKDFDAALAKTQAARDERQAYAEVWRELAEAELDAEKHESQVEKEQANLHDAESRLTRAQQSVAPLKEAHQHSLQAQEHHHAHRPGYPKLLLSIRPAARRWWERERELSAQASTAEDALADARKRKAQAERTVNEHTEQVTRHAQGKREAHERIEALTTQIAVETERWETGYPEAVYPGEDWGEDAQRARRELRAPWLDATWDSARTELFLAALELHKAFVLGAASKIKQSLSVAIDVIQDSSRSEIPAHAARAAWQCLFLTVPVVSTTFASYPRLFRHLGREDLGWLLIDEASQGSPQNAAGPIWRARNVLVVGDPMQLEPIVPLPLSTQKDLQHAYNVPDTVLPSHSSVQSLADGACRLGAWRGSDGELWVGAPLSVHRRCEQPMFDIVNRIAYDDRMIEHTPLREETLLPQSHWLHVEAEHAQGHWIPEEGIRLQRLLAELADIDEPFPEVFLISPFRDVANHLARYKNEYPITAGTVHTAQGKEADVVILVLGGDPNKTGDKHWASQRPNLLNVAVSRAMRRLYVIGNHEIWSNYPYFDTLATALPIEAPAGAQDHDNEGVRDRMNARSGRVRPS